MNNRGETNVWGPILVVAFVLFAVAITVGLWQSGIIFSGEQEKAVAETKQTETTKEIITESKGGKIATIGVYVRDLSANNIDTKLNAVATYCVDDAGVMVIDGASSSSSAEITGKTGLNKVVTCYAFDSTHQTLIPVVTTIDEEFEHIVVDAYTLADDSEINIRWYNDVNSVSSSLGSVNFTSVGADISQTLAKMRITNNATNKFYPLAGVYFDRVVGSNVSELDLAGSVTILGQAGNPNADLVASDLSTRVSSRKDQWDFIFEFKDDEAKTEAKDVVLLEESDYLESGLVTVLGDGDGCVSGSDADVITPYAFARGYYRLTKSTGIANGHEDDASSATGIGTDPSGEQVYCT